MTEREARQDRGDRLRVGPYTITAGRVRSDTELAIETIIVTTGKAESPAASLRTEWQDICRLCADPISIVEISARLHLPLGVVRVLVGDMVIDGLVTPNRLDEANADSDGRPDQRLLERILHGLQAI